jgi:signal transduction histidine kinase
VRSRGPWWRGLWWRFLAISVLFALALSLLYVVLVRETTGTARAALQRSITLFIAKSLEEAPYAASMKHLDQTLSESPEMPRDIWVLDAQGRVLAARSDAAPPLDVVKLDASMKVHEVRSIRAAWIGGLQMSATRLATAEPTFLVTRNSGVVGRPILRFQTMFFVGALMVAVFLGLSLVTLYMRARSREARLLIARLEAGELHARFEPGPLDALGELMLDFNRMADEIERLVRRLQAAEDARGAMLQELGHDLRTPLTSLRTAIDAVSVHGDSMSAADRENFLDIIRCELDYFVRLIDDLFFIADIAEPRYRHSTQQVDAVELLASELRTVQTRWPQTAAGRPLGFSLDDEHAAGAQRMVAGDRMLLARLFRNALDNAAKHAASGVQVTARAADGSLEVVIADDGPGMAAADIAAFGSRRTRRLQTDATRPSLSLGLGSVIMKTIVGLHAGELTIESGAAEPRGTRIRIRLPR